MATPINKILSNQTQAFSQEELANISASLQEILGQGGGGTQSDYVFIPVFNEQTGDITFMLSTTGASGRGPWHISGAQGPAGADGANGTDGKDGKDGKDGYSVTLQSVTDEDGGKKVTLAWGETPETSSFVIPSGAKGVDGQNGQNGENGTSVIVKSIREFNDVVGTHTKGGTEVTLEWNEGQTVKTSAFSAFNGEKGQDGTGTTLTASSGINIDDNNINVKLGKNLKFDTYQNVTTEDNISAFSVRAGQYENQYTIVNKNGVESHFTSSPDLHLMTLTTHGLNNATTGANRCITADYDLNHLFFKSYDNNGTYSGDYSQVEIKVLQAEQPAETQHRSSIALTDYYGGVEHTGLITVEKIAQWDQGGGFTGVTTTGSISGDGLTNPLGLKTSAEQAIAAVGGKLSSPTLTADTYYVLHCDDNNALQWEDFDTYLRDSVEAITEDMGTLYEDAMNPENGLSAYFDENSYAYHFGIDTTDMVANKQYAFTTTGWEEVVVPSTSGYLPLSGGIVSGSTYFSAANGQNMLAVASAASLIGASRQSEANFGQNNTAMGTTWMGVGGPDMYRGFLKYTQGGNVGDLDSNNTMQVEFTPNNKGTIFAKAKNSGNDCPETQILNPTKASCDAMTQSANANLVSGPNYMLAKNADGQFVIGAACINCTAINDVTLAPNTYYFVYEA